MIEDDLCILRAKYDRQPLPKFAQCDVRQRYREAPMAHDPLLQSSRFQPTGGRQVPSASERRKRSESTNTETLLAA